jgi:hypothetical protein
MPLGVRQVQIDHFCLEVNLLFTGGRGAGADCVNANCKPTEVEVMRNRCGDKSSCCVREFSPTYLMLNLELTHRTAGRDKVMCCEVAVLDPDSSKVPFCGDPCDDIDPDLCINEGLPTDIASGSPSKRDLAIVPDTTTHELEKRREVNLNRDVAAFLGIVVGIVLRAYFGAGEYFNAQRRGAPVQGFYIQDAPLNPPANNANAIQTCQNGALRLVRMTQQSHLTIYNGYRPQTEHPIDVSNLVY